MRGNAMGPETGAHARGSASMRDLADVLIGPTQSSFPEFDDSGRKFTPRGACASAGLRPHFKQRVIFAKQVTL